MGWITRRLIGGFIGLIPGIGGNIADWFAYSQTVAVAGKKGENIGKGNVRGVIGCEGANNAQKATVITYNFIFQLGCIFFEVIVMGLLMYVIRTWYNSSVLMDEHLHLTYC